MPSVENDLYDTYLSDKKEIEDIDKILNETIKIFIAFYDNNEGWAYEIRHNETLEKIDFSFSTSIMILHTISASLGKLQKSNISFGIDGDNCIYKNPFIDKETTGELNVIKDKGLKLIIAKSQNKQANYSITFNSSNYGTNDPFSYAWFLEIFFSSSDNYADYKKALINDAYKMLKKAIKSLDNGGNKGFFKWMGSKGEEDRFKHYESLNHSFPLLRAINVLLILHENDHHKSYLIKKLYDENIEKLSQHCLTCIYRHLSLRHIEYSDFDVAELVLSLESYLLLSRKLNKNINKNLIDRIFNIVEESQKKSAYWRPLKPFVKTDTGFVLLPLSIEIINSLSRICRFIYESNLNENYFTPYIQVFKRYTTWLLTRIEKGSTKDLKEFIGWHSENVLETGVVHPWDTSQVVLYLLQYRSLLKEHIAKRSLIKTNLFSSEIPRKSKETGKEAPEEIEMSAIKYWENHWQKNEPLCSERTESNYHVFKMIGEKYIKPRSERSDSMGYSMLLYGPPGTGKTAIAQEIAKSLKWNLITITPSNFIKKGESEVENRANDIFTALLEQDNCVILFDEIDRLILDRASKEYHSQSDIFQFMTPGMLVKIKNLRDKENSIFIIATNYEDRIDPAIKRIGRIDDKFMIAPPDSDQRFRIIKKEILEYAKMYNELPKKCQQIEKDDLKKGISKTVLYKHGELKRFVSEAMNKFQSEGSKTKEVLIKIINEDVKISSPELTLSSYIYRFKDENKKLLTSNQKPYEEYLILFYLKYLDFTSEPVPDSDKNIFKEILMNNGTDGDDPESIIESAVENDDHISKKLIEYYKREFSNGK